VCLDAEKHKGQPNQREFAKITPFLVIEL
jgi:hypothetical protein